jgi:hypothetical protein
MQVLETPEDADVIRNAKVPTGAEGQVADEKRGAVSEKQSSQESGIMESSVRELIMSAQKENDEEGSGVSET